MSAATCPVPPGIGLRRPLAVLPFQVLLLLCLYTCLQACTPAGPDLQTQGQAYLETWFAQARQHGGNNNGDDLCHGLGTLKHPEFSCGDYVRHAADVTPASRILTRAGPRECFDTVCGEFVEFSFTGTDLAGNPNDEEIILKRDGNRLQVYWYRSTSLLAAWRQVHPEQQNTEARAPLQVAYDAITARHPDLYAYPPCDGTRPSSTTLRTAIMALDDMDPDAIHTAASSCDNTFCFALVGQKVAGLCP